MAKIHKLLEDLDKRLDYRSQIISKYPWIIEKGQSCIISPDSDGLLCGLFMSNFLDWKVKGFYDGKVMLLAKDVSPEDCVFLDMEIFRKGIKSVGHHMVLYNIKDKDELPNWDNFDNCIQANNMRKCDGLHKFRVKYPFATIHFLLGIIDSHIKITLPDSAICPLLFTDGVYKILFSYPENALNWGEYLLADVSTSPLKKILRNDSISIYDIMRKMDEFFKKRDEFAVARERGDFLKISNSKGEPYNVSTTGDGVVERAAKRAQGFIQLLSQLTEWGYKQGSWTWDNMKLYKFTKESFDKKRRVNGDTFKQLIQENPLSWAMTSNENIEYTLEKPDTLRTT